MFIDILDSALTNFLHPFRIYDYYWSGISLPKREFTPVKKLSLTEGITFSWFIILVRGFVDLILLNLAFMGVSYFQKSHQTLFSIFDFDITFSGYYLMLIELIFLILVFPLWTLMSCLFWKFFFTKIGEFFKDEQSDEKAELIVTTALSANFLKVIPIVGDALYSLYHPFMLFAGFKKSFDLSHRSAIMAMSIPFLLMATFGIFIFICLMLITSI